MNEFNWEGKELAYKLAQTPSTGTLIPCKEESKNWDTTENLYIEGDNLEVLKLLQKTYYGKIKMIYIDPPYNTGKDFVYHDDFKDNISNCKEIANQMTSSNPETNGRYHTNWLNMMYPRLKLARNLLREDGVIFMNIGQEELDNTIKLVKEIFGENNYISCISRVTKKTSNSGTFFAPSIDYIIVACKSIDCVKYFKSDLTDEQKKSFNLNDSRGSYKLVGFYQASLELERSRNARYYIDCPDGSKCIPKENKRWRTVKGTYDDFLRNNMIVFKKTKNSPLIDENGKQSIWNIYTKSYANSRIEDGNVPREYIDNYCNNMGTRCLNKLNIPFEFSKPKELVQYLIKICNMDSEGIVLDFFSGSSTTAHATINFNKDEKTNLKFIMVQLPELTDEKSEAYKAGYKNICEIGKERIRRAGDKIVSENKDKEGIENLDIGFKVFKLDYTDKGDDKMYNEELISPITIEVLTNKKPKELKGKKKIATINKDKDYKVQVFVDDDYNLYYQDNHAFASCESKIVGNKVETVWYSCKCWFKIIGLYKCRNNHIVDILRDLNQYSEHLYPKNNVADNIAMSRLYEQMVNIYLDYIHNNN